MPQVNKLSMLELHITDILKNQWVCVFGGWSTHRVIWKSGTWTSDLVFMINYLEWTKGQACRLIKAHVLGVEGGFTMVSPSAELLSLQHETRIKYQ